MAGRRKKRAGTKNGYSLEEAFWKFTDPGLLAVYKEKAEKGDFRRPVTVGSDRWRARRQFYAAQGRAVSSFRKLFRDGVLVAVGAEGSPTAPLKKIPDYSWATLKIVNFTGILKAPGDLRIFVVRVHPSTEFNIGKRKNFDLVSEAFNAAPTEVRELHRKRGGTKQTVDYLYQVLRGEIPRSSVDREFTNVKKSKGLGKPEK